MVMTTIRVLSGVGGIHYQFMEFKFGMFLILW